jgi:hypothetical protein
MYPQNPGNSTNAIEGYFDGLDSTGSDTLQFEQRYA